MQTTTPITLNLHSVLKQNAETGKAFLPGIGLVRIETNITPQNFETGARRHAKFLRKKNATKNWRRRSAMRFTERW